MTDSRSTAIQYAHDNANRFLDDLKEFSTIPSISTDEAAKSNILRVYILIQMMHPPKNACQHDIREGLSA